MQASLQQACTAVALSRGHNTTVHEWSCNATSVMMPNHATWHMILHTTPSATLALRPCIFLIYLRPIHACDIHQTSFHPYVMRDCGFQVPFARPVQRTQAASKAGHCKHVSVMSVMINQSTFVMKCLRVPAAMVIVVWYTMKRKLSTQSPTQKP